MHSKTHSTILLEPDSGTMLRLYPCGAVLHGYLNAKVSSVTDLSLLFFVWPCTSSCMSLTHIL